MVCEFNWKKRSCNRFQSHVCERCVYIKNYGMKIIDDINRNKISNDRRAMKYGE